MNDRIENTILNSFVFQETLLEKEILSFVEILIQPFLKRDERILFEQVEKFIHQYNNLLKGSILIELNNKEKI